MYHYWSGAKNRVFATWHIQSSNVCSEVEHSIIRDLALPLIKSHVGVEEPRSSQAKASRYGGRNDVNHIAICSKLHVRLAGTKTGDGDSAALLPALTWARHCNSGREAERSQQQEDKST
jgi:hypothetical protein